MTRKRLFILLAGTAALSAAANQQPTSNDNPAYSQSNIQAQLRLNIRENAEVVHFIRDTADPHIITKTYVLKHADPYSIRPYLREMVQALRVDYNNPAGRANPAYYNTYSKDNAAKTEKIFVPTGIECVKFVDGTGVLMISAEDYRFQDHAGGMGIDSLVAMLDTPGIMNSSGQPKYIYFPANRSARELQTMIKLVGANISNDTVELIGGKDKVEVDEELNCLFFNTALYSRKNIEEMLRLYDVAYPEIRMTCTVYELDAENDGMLGMDFQSWKNNHGARLFQSGANWSHNANLSGTSLPIKPDGTLNTHYFNFEPKWNSRFLDFLVSRGSARVITTGDLTVRNGTTGTMTRSTGLLHAALTPLPAEPDQPQPGNAVDIRPANELFQFELNLTPSITQNAATVEFQVATTSLLGYTSDGAPRTEHYESGQKFMIGTGRNRFYLGGIEKTRIVRDVAGVPLLKDLPILGRLFSTERESTKKTQLVVVAECEIIHPATVIDETDLRQIEMIRHENDFTGNDNSYGFRQYGLDRKFSF